MRALILGLLALLAPLAPHDPAAWGADAPAPLLLDDFETGAEGWRFVGGEEFPGAKGAMQRLTDGGHGGRGALRLDANFRGGGAYVGLWRDLAPLRLGDLAEFRVRVRSWGTRWVGIRLVDSTGQCHQSRVDLPPGSGEGWRELVLPIARLSGGEHWGGANDGRWHGPPTGLGLNIGRDALISLDDPMASLTLDDLVGVPVPAGVPTLSAVTVSPATTRPGYGTRVRYVWDAQPLGVDCSVFVHVRDEAGRTVFQADHDPGVPTRDWRGAVAYSRTIVVPDNLAPGRYSLMVGLWDGRPARVGGGRKAFRIGSGSGLRALPDDACEAGTFTVATDAPLPVLPAATLDLRQYELTFDEGFAGPLSISADGPGTRWTAHTPYHGDFGDARFANPGGPDSPFRVADGLLAIEAKKEANGRWRSGLICSVDPKGQGFSQQYGYFEMRAKLPKGLGTWPAFWLMGVERLTNPASEATIHHPEIDVVEQYGVGPNALHTTVHLWGPGKFHTGDGDATLVAGMTDDFHTYGVDITEATTTFYFDGSVIRQEPTLASCRVPLYLMVDLALGGGWPIDQTPSPSVLLVDHVRAYRRR